MLRKAMYASLVESKKPSPLNKVPHSNHSATSSETASSSGSHDSTSVNCVKGDEIISRQHSTPDEFDNNNSPGETGQFSVEQSIDSEIHKKIKEPSKLLNYVIKKKKEKRTNSQNVFRTLSPTKLVGSGEGSFSAQNGKSKKRRRQRGALAVFVAMNKSAGGKKNGKHFSGAEKDILKTKRRRRRKRRGLEAQILNRADTESEESPVKKLRKEDRKQGSGVVHAQRKFAKTHPLSPTSIRLQEERNILSSSSTRAKTEDFLTFLCLRNNPVLPKELEIFNNPCLPMSPLLEDDEDDSSPPSPTQSQSSMSNSSNPSSTLPKSFSDSPVPSVDSPATGEGPSWESGVVRMYADGPKGLAGSRKEQKKYDEFLPSDEADDARERAKSVTPPLAFRVSSRPTNWTVYKARDKQLPRPIPKPFAVKPSLTGAETNRSSFSQASTNSAGDTSAHSSPLLLHPSESSCSPPPPPLLYIPAAAQRVTHLREPPTLQRFPSTSPSRDQESDEQSDHQSLLIDRDDGPPQLKRFPPVVIEHESAKTDHESAASCSNKPFLTQNSSSEVRLVPSWSPNKKELKVVSSAANSPIATSGRSSSSLCDLTKISQMETEAEGASLRWRNKEMPLLRRHSSATQDTVCFEERVNFPERPRAINSSGSPPQLQRAPVQPDTDIQRRLGGLQTSGGRFKTSGSPTETSGGRLDTSGSRLESSSSPFESSNSESSSGRLGSPGSPLVAFSGLETSCGRPEFSFGRLVPSDSRLSPNFPSHPPRLVRHLQTTRPGLPEANLSITSLQHHPSTPGDSNQRQPSPLAFSTHRSAQSFQERNYARPIPIAEASPASARQSPLFTAGKDRNKSTYVFANRQTFVPAEKEPRPVKVSSLFMPSKNCFGATPNRTDANSMRFQSTNDFSQSDERRFLQVNSPQFIQNQYPGPHIHQSHENVRGANAGLLLANGQFSDSVGSKRIPSPRSDLLSRISHEPVISSCMSRIDVPSSGSSSLRGESMALRPIIRHNDNTLESFPPVWSHLQSPYSVPSIAARNSPPKPYTLSVNLPSSLSTRHPEVQTVESRSNSSTPVLEGYSLAPIQSSDQQQVSVIQCTNFSKGEPGSSVQREHHIGEHGNSRTYHLPSAFQGGGSRLDSRTNVIFSQSAFSDTSVRERSMRQTFLNDHRAEDLNRENSSSSLHRVENPTRPPFSNSPNLNGNIPSPLIRDTELQAYPSSSKSPNLKGKKTSVSDLPVVGGITEPKKPCSSPKIAGKDAPASKHKGTVCPTLSKKNDSPVFSPSEEEFKDPGAYIKMIRHEAEKFGVCVIVPPESWKPEFLIPDNLRFVSEYQLIHRLQDRWGPVEEELACIKKHLDQQSISLVPMPQIGGYELDLPHFSRVVKQFGGLQKVIDNKKWTKVAEILKIPRAAQDRIGKLQDIYCKYLLSYDLLPQDEKAELLRLVRSERESKANHEQDIDSWSVKSRNLSLVPFQRLARNIQGHFFKNPPSVNDVEREFWKIVHNRENFVSVYRGTLDTNQEHSCFPTGKGDPYSKLGWNLNVLPHLPDSVLKHVGFLQDVTIPWLQLDMLFSAKSWQTHPLALYTVDYLHSGADKIWYSVPAGERKNLASFYGQDADAVETSLADKMVSPSSLNEGGVTVTRVVQKQGQFVIVFPEAYYSSVSCGYSVSEAVAFAPFDWLLLGSKRYKDLRESSWWSDFNYDRLLLGMAQELNDDTQELVPCLLAELKQIRDEEKFCMIQLLELGLVETVDEKKTSSESPGGKKGKKSLTSWTQSDSSCVLYCEECDRACYLSAVIGEDDPQVLCLKHAVKHIRDKASPKGFRILNRYDTSRLDELVNKVEEKLKKLEA